MPNETPRPPDLTGSPTAIGPYKVLQRIGRGAMGLVYSARDEAMDRTIALKVLIADLEAEPDIRARFYREARVAAQLQHRNIVTILDMGEESSRLFIVMELLRGWTLAEYLRTNSDADLEQKLDLMTQICEGLGAAHARGVYHRDVKPGNLFVQTDGSLKVLDFGIARIASSALTSAGLLVGTPDFMAPEQARGEDVDQRSDIFSTGAVFYLMISGRKPFDAPDLPTVLHNVEHEAPLPLRDDQAPADLRRIVFTTLEKNPADRYQRMGELLVDLIRFRRGFEAETRRRTAAAAGRLAQMHAQFAERADVALALGVVRDGDRPDPLVTLRAQYSHLAERGDESLAALPLRRRQADAIAAAVEEACSQIGADVARLILARDELAAARSAEVQDPRRAVAHYDRALGACPDSPLLQREAAAARERAAERQTIEERVAAFREEASLAYQRRDWSASVAACDQGLLLDNTDAELVGRRTAAARAQAEAERAHFLELKRLADTAQQAIEDARFDEAQELILRLCQLEPDDERLVVLNQNLKNGERAQAAARALTAETTALLAHARALFTSGAHDAALAALRAFIETQPASVEARREMELLTAEATRLAARARRRAEASELAAQAEAAWQGGEAEAALRAAEAALNLDRGHVVAVRVHAQVRAHLRTLAERADRVGKASEHLSNARGHLERQQWVDAGREAELALSLDPGNEAAPALIAEARQAHDDAELERAAQESAARRARAAQPAIETARAALLRGESSRARWAAESALALDPDNAAARDVLMRALAAPTRERTGAAAAADPDDTVSIVLRPSVSTRLKDGARQFGQAVSSSVLFARERTQSWAFRGPKNSSGSRPRADR